METRHNEFQLLLQQYAEGQLSRAEFELLLSHMRDPDMDPGVAEQVLERDWAQLPMDYPYSPEAAEKLFENIKSDERYRQSTAAPDHKRKSLPMFPWKRIGIAAAVAAIIFGAGLFHYYHTSDHTGLPETYVNDAAPGKQGATLTLASGKKILINDAMSGKVAQESGVRVSKTADGQIIYEITGQETGVLQYHTLTTSRGQQTQLRLPDGSRVFLNAASSLKYPVDIATSKVRRVILTGEAYFEISKSYASMAGHRERQAFVVESRGQQVEVLGTHFNINSYADEPDVVTTLLEGSVKVLHGGKQLILTPGQQSINTGKALLAVSADVENVTDWKNGEFYFHHADFRAVLREIGRWYDVEIIYDESVPARISSTGLISRNKKLSEVLQSIEKAGNVRFRIEGAKVYVSK